MITVIVVEDEVAFRETVCDFLAMRGFRALGVGSEKALEATLAGVSGAIVLLDVNLGRESGFAIARRLRGRDSSVGIIMLTARDGIDDQITGLGAGADIYLAKPVDLRALEANVVSLTRRLSRGEDHAAEATAGWSLDATGWMLLAPNGAPVSLTAGERAFMARLLRSPGETVGFTDLIAATGGIDDAHGVARLAVLVNRLRRKVERETGFPPPVRSARSVGYGFAATVEAPPVDR